MKFFSFLLIAILTVVPAFAQADRSIPVDDPAENVETANNRAGSAARVFDELMSKPDSAVPQALLDKAEAVIIIPGAIRAAFGIGGRGGRGIVTRRTTNGWSEPVFVKIGGGSFGAQIGVTQTDYVFLVMNQSGLKGLMDDGFELGGDIGATAGPVGREASASTNLTLNAEILSYSRSRGLFAGVALRGIRIYADDSLNQKVYNRTGKEILEREAGLPMADIPESLRIVPETVSRHSSRIETAAN
ncbi:MAG TPA: lipid-binding SYLF domain-containing protein [Pyrinomonadaceae bacterium]|nr:lipid-binding SYLF domain-containing protein [Pyrinomonadaceae bacterium]